MDERMKELIAIGASAAVNCHPCMDYHLAECDRLGLDRDEVKAAMEVGLMVSRGAAAKTRDKADALMGKAQKGGAGGCGCGT
ncbi:MAG: carboxymuconolactone decarboxylase family protein [Rhodospirillaceae bacterium]|nr:carboxymuconolactone decarboxylase family protein [Rhodospirillales bacterium]